MKLAFIANIEQSTDKMIYNALRNMFIDLIENHDVDCFLLNYSEIEHYSNIILQSLCKKYPHIKLYDYVESNSPQNVSTDNSRNNGQYITVETENTFEKVLEDADILAVCYDCRTCMKKSCNQQVKMNEVAKMKANGKPYVLLIDYLSKITSILPGTYEIEKYQDKLDYLQQMDKK